LFVLEAPAVPDALLVALESLLLAPVLEAPFATCCMSVCSKVCKNPPPTSLPVVSLLPASAPT
jgi:hypothetical protein